MMRHLLGRVICWLFRAVTSLRYDVEVRGLTELGKNPKEGGVLFLPNHPSHMDPVLLVPRLYGRWKARPMIAERVYYLPGLHGLFKTFLRAVPMPGFERASNSYKLERTARAEQKVIQGLKKRENFVIWPAGRLKRTPEERVGGASAVHGILQKVPSANVVLVRTTGLWGSRFSWGVTGKRPDMGKGFQGLFKMVLKNLIFFTPRRKVIVEFERAPEELYHQPSRQEFNRYLERWYNKGGGEPLKLVRYSRWKKDYPKVTYQRPYLEADIEQVPIDVRRQVTREIARLSKRKVSDIRPEMHLFTDLGLDSLDIAELVSALERQRGVRGEAWDFDLLTVGSVMALAAGKFEMQEEEEAQPAPKEWAESSRPEPQLPEGETLLEAWLDTCDRMDGAIAFGDVISGAVSYDKFKLRALALSRVFKRLPGKDLGILLPASGAVQVVIAAAWLAGKRPVMLNWTIGRRYLEHVREVSDLKAVISSWAFLDGLDGADLTPIHGIIVTLEALRVRIPMKHLRWAKKWSKKSAEAILDEVGRPNPTDPAVLLFTSGTEALPKAVPLSHFNILSNQRAAVTKLDAKATDALLNILPPFHSLGFTITTLVPMVTGLKAVHSPDPTNAPRLARDIERFEPTIICAAPTFVRGLLGACEPKSLRLFIVGAEKTPAELVEQIQALGSHVQLMEGYGITECSPVLTLSNLGELPKGVGYPIEGVDLLIVDPETHQVVPQGRDGLILARGPGVFSGYLEREVASPFIEVGGKSWYNTGDLGHIQEDGSLALAGRLKRFVKIGGEMVSLPAIEAALIEATTQQGWGRGQREHHLAVVATSDDARPELTLFANYFIDLQEANDTLRKMGFSNLSRLSHFEHLADMPLLGTGKIDLRALEKRAEDLSDRRRLESYR